MSRCDQQTKNNRVQFPATAAILDKFRAEFGQGVKLVYAVESGQEIGKRPVAPKWFTTVDRWLKYSALIEEELARRENKPMFDYAGKLKRGSR